MEWEKIFVKHRADEGLIQNMLKKKSPTTEQQQNE